MSAQLRYPIFFPALAVSLVLTMLSSAGQATEFNVAMLDRSPLHVNQVLVRKEERRLYLMSDEEVIRSYRISLGGNPYGHKLFEGDQRTPEGSYTLDWRNPGSDFYKSIHISYPNKNDRSQAAAWGQDPGGSIMIHGLPNGAEDMAFAYTGLDWTEGCIAVANHEMDEIWQLVSDGTPIQIVP
ncbi:murein L,D-transpeptidase family protein [Marinobacter sp.]|uniref:L,D-transpeptidase family protein n=1 Tax=Marinobacter sp. TaxID=50741 RepID=UPI00384FBC12